MVPLWIQVSSYAGAQNLKWRVKDPKLDNLGIVSLQTIGGNVNDKENWGALVYKIALDPRKSIYRKYREIKGSYIIRCCEG